MNKTDDIYGAPLAKVPDFVFDDKVADVFGDMISRSVPGYATITAVSGVLSQRFSQPNTRLYDLGCSLGATSFSIAQSAAEGCECIAVDNSPAMISRLQKLLTDSPDPLELSTSSETLIKPMEANVEDVDIENASVVTMNFTLQFLPVSKRLSMLKKICDGLNDKGVLLLSEKIHMDDPLVNELFVDLHHNFKLNNGYSELEVSQKRDAIENVLIPETLEVHKQRLFDAGFSRVETWFQCFNFVSLVAFK